MRSTRAVFLVCLLLVSAAVPLTAQMAFPSPSNQVTQRFVSIPKGGAAILETESYMWFYDATSHKGMGISKTTKINDDWEKITFTLK